MIYILKESVKDFLKKVNIVKTISSRIILKKIGNKYISLCPFHNEKKPSFIVNEYEGYYYCFGCKNYGNAIDFLMKFNNLSFLDSIKELSLINNISILDENFKNNIIKDVNKDIYLNLMYKISLKCNKYLLNNKNMYLIREYLFNRGLNIKIIKKFLIGFLTKNILNIIKSSLSKDEISFLINLKLFNINNIFFLDKLYNRIIFPIFDIYNNIIGFGGRILYLSKFSKYINISNNKYFIKRYILYGFNFLRKKNLKFKRILIVEGYLDVIILNQLGIYYVVGLLGSLINDWQINFLFFYTNKIIFCYDGDNSGINSTKKTVLLVLKYINEVKECFFIILPLNQDPNSLVNKEGIKKFKLRIKNSISWYNILYYFYLYKKNLLTFNKKIYLIKKITYYIKYIKSNFIKNFLYQKISNKVGLNQNKLFSIINNICLIKKKKNKHNIVRYLISLLLKYMYLSNYINLYDELFNYNIYNLFFFLRIVKICVYLNKKNNINNIINYFDKNWVKKYIEYLYFKNFFIIKENDEKKVFLNFLRKLKLILINKRINLIFSNNKNYEWNIKNKKLIWNLIKIKNLLIK